MEPSSQWWNVAMIGYAIIVYIVLFFCWLVYVSRGRRAVVAEFKGLGLQISINTADRDTKPAELGER